MHKFRYPIKNLKFYLLSCALASYIFIFTLTCLAQQAGDLEFTLDIDSNAVALPKIFKPNIDLSGRGLHRMASWPQGVAAKEVLDTWQKNIGFNGVYRIQFNLWEINERAKDTAVQAQLLLNYEDIIKKINDDGGIVILDIFGTPAGLGRALDRKSAPYDLRAFKELVKKYVREFSCNKKYNIWYEVWSAPDLDDFFLGRRQEYLGMYRAVAEGIKELEAEVKINIPLGGPGTSWWFQDCDSNTIITPERSLIYDLIKYCSHYRLPLDFISWHAYSTDPKAELEITGYNKTSIALIRDWLDYFNFDRNTPLIIDEWNYDSGANLLPERAAAANIGASFIPARLKYMYEAGLDYQLYFCLEDFQNNKEKVARNVGIFRFDSESSGYKGAPKVIYNVFRMLRSLGDKMFVLPKLDDEFVGKIATRQDDYIAVIFYNYIDPYAARDYLSRNITTLNDAERKIFLNLVKSDKLEKIISRQVDISGLRITGRLKTMLKKAQELDGQAAGFKSSERKINFKIKNLKDNYLYQRYSADSSCALNCNFVPAEEKEIGGPDLYQEELTLPPYSVQLVTLKKKPPEEAPVVSEPEPAVSEEPQSQEPEQPED